MNEKPAGVPVLLYEKTTIYCFSDLSLNGNLYVLNVRALVRTLERALMMQVIMRSRWCPMQNRWITLRWLHIVFQRGRNGN